jgi:hypothetical protein
MSTRSAEFATVIVKTNSNKKVILTTVRDWIVIYTVRRICGHVTVFWNVKMYIHLHISKSPKVRETAVIGRQVCHSNASDRSVRWRHAVTTSNYLSTFRRGNLPKEPFFTNQSPFKLVTFRWFLIRAAVQQGCYRHSMNKQSNQFILLLHRM